MALRGDLDSWPIRDVLGLLGGAGKTGYLRVEATGRLGVVWFRDGRITAATTDAVPEAEVTEALGDLLRFQAGSFDFELDDRAPEGGGQPSVEALLGEAQELLAEWDDLRFEIPSLDCDLGLAKSLPDGEVTVTADQWRAMAEVADGCTVSRFAAGLGLTELGALRAVRDLTASGLLDVYPPTAGDYSS